MNSVLTELMHEIHASGALAFGKDRVIQLLTEKLPAEKALLDARYEQGKTDTLSKLHLNDTAAR